MLLTVAWATRPRVMDAGPPVQTVSQATREKAADTARVTLHAGDSWIADRTIRYTNSAAEIDMQDDDHFVFFVESEGDTQKLRVHVARNQIGTHLSSGVYVPVPAAPPEEWNMPLGPDGALSMSTNPIDKIESILTRIVFSLWNGPVAKPLDKLILVKPLSTNRLRVTYDESPIGGEVKIEGEASINARTHVPETVSLRGTRVPIPGGVDIVSIRVEYTVRSVKH